MRNISVSNDIIPVGQFKANLAKYLKEIQAQNNSLIITQNGRPVGVLISPKEFDKLMEAKLFIESVSRGISDSELGDVFTTSQLKRKLSKHRATRTL